MTAPPANHLARIANFFGYKLDELRFHLETIIDHCEESLACFQAGQPKVEGKDRRLVYGFSSFTNTIQTLKDAGGMLAPDALPWSKIKALRHGGFMKDVRNAITHDGNPVISAWADGRYFVPNKIVRFEYEKVVVIDPPAVDVRQFCLEFTADFARLLSQILKDIPDDERLSMSIFDINEIDVVLRDSAFMPEFAKKILAEQRDEIQKYLQETRVPHIEEAIKKADDLAVLCSAKLS